MVVIEMVCEVVVVTVVTVVLVMVVVVQSDLWELNSQPLNHHTQTFKVTLVSLLTAP